MCGMYRATLRGNDLATASSCIVTSRVGVREDIMKVKISSHKKVVVRESHALTNIDGFLVTDGDRARVTLNARLDQKDKDRGRKTLLDRMRLRQEPGVYLWNTT